MSEVYDKISQTEDEAVRCLQAARNSMHLTVANLSDALVQLETLRKIATVTETELGNTIFSDNPKQVPNFSNVYTEIGSNMVKFMAGLRDARVCLAGYIAAIKPELIEAKRVMGEKEQKD